MGWLTSLPTGKQQRQVIVTEKKWRFDALSGWQYATRPITTTVENFDAMDQSTANTQAALMNSDTTTEGVRTIVTASVERQNDADAHRIIKTTKVEAAWGEWT